MIWTPHVTVAAIIEREGRFLLVEEETDTGLMLNQPAGHLENNESLIHAVIRETLEETAWHFRPEALVGVYHWRQMEKDITFIRFAFTGSVTHFEADRILDNGIVRALWLTHDEISAEQARHRSPQVMQCISDYLAGRRARLEIVSHLT